MTIVVALSCYTCRAYDVNLGNAVPVEGVTGALTRFRDELLKKPIDENVEYVSLIYINEKCEVSMTPPVKVRLWPDTGEQIEGMNVTFPKSCFDDKWNLRGKIEKIHSHPYKTGKFSPADIKSVIDGGRYPVPGEKHPRKHDTTSYMVEQVGGDVYKLTPERARTGARDKNGEIDGELVDLSRDNTKCSTEKAIWICPSCLKGKSGPLLCKNEDCWNFAEPMYPKTKKGKTAPSKR